MLNCVLLIDDSEADLLFSRIVLERSGITRQVVSFECGREALAWLRAADAPVVDLILLDINMPGMTGFEFLEACANEDPPRTTPAVVMLSSSADPEDHRRALRFPNVRGFATKPLALAQAQRLPELLRS